LGVPAIDPDAAARHRPLLDALDVAVNGPEAAARHWYRLLTGERRPRTPINPHEEERVRQRLCWIYPDDPQRVEAELLAMRTKSFDDADAHCWGPNGRYLDDAMAAYCDLTPSQVKKMTWPEIAAELKAACQREGLLPPAQHVPADTASDKPAAEPRREGTAGWRPDTPTVAYCLLPGRRVRWEGEPVELQKRLWDLLEYLLTRRCPLQQGAIEATVWGEEEITSKTFANTISRLNAALAAISFPWTWRVSAGEVFRD
jgi:hypothetical protein